MTYNKNVEITIPKNPQKGKFFKRLFVPALIILISLGSFGFGRLFVIVKNRPPVTLETSAENLAAAATSDKVSEASTAPLATKPSPQGLYVAARGGTAYYYPWCPAAARISEKNKVWFSSKEEAEKAGYKPAKNCKGLQ